MEENKPLSRKEQLSLESKRLRTERAAAKAAHLEMVNVERFLWLETILKKAGWPEKIRTDEIYAAYKGNKRDILRLVHWGMRNFNYVRQPNPNSKGGRYWGAECSYNVYVRKAVAPIEEQAQNS